MELQIGIEIVFNLFFVGYFLTPWNEFESRLVFCLCLGLKSQSPKIRFMALEDLSGLVQRLREEGIRTERLDDWQNKGLLGIMLGTESGAYYIVEPVGNPSLVTRLSEAPPYYGEYRMPATEAMVRRQGNPDRRLELGNPMNILGLSRKGPEFDPDSLYTTTPLVEITYLEAAG